MNELNYPETTKWVVAHNNEDIFIATQIEPQNCFSTGQPYMEIFDTEEEAKAAFPQAFSNIEDNQSLFDNSNFLI